MYVLKIFIAGNTRSFGFTSVTDEPEIEQNSCLRHAIGNYFEIELL